MTRDVEILFGPPGTGKTTALIHAVELAMQDGTPPERIAYVAFSRKAAHEAKARALAKFSSLAAADLTWFRTLHATAYHRLALRKGQVLTTQDFATIGKDLGLTFRGHYESEWGLMEGGSLGDRCLAVVALATATRRTIRDTLHHMNLDRTPLEYVERFADALTRYKAGRDCLDFSDMLDRDQGGALDVDLFILDEAQDLTPQQWDYAKRLGAKARTVMIAGDDDQSIFTFQGADAKRMLRIAGERRVLPISYRLPVTVKRFADELIANVPAHERAPKTFYPQSRQGSVNHVRDVSDCDLLQGQWLLLCRHRIQLHKLEAECRAQGVVYKRGGAWSNETDEVRAVLLYERLRAGGTIKRAEWEIIRPFCTGELPRGEAMQVSWDDVAWPFEGKPDWMTGLGRLSAAEREYIRELRRRGESLTKPGRVEISTIHSAKGGEAPNVYLDWTPNDRVRRAMRLDPADEWRVRYVGATRAKENLYVRSTAH